MIPSVSVRGAALVLAVLLSAIPFSHSFGQATGAFTRVGFGARGIGVANSVAADRSGLTSPFYNPALAPFASGQHLDVSAAIMRFDRQLQYLQFATPLRPRAGVAAGLIHAGVSNIDGRDSNGFHTEELSTDEFAFFLAFGLKFSDKVSGGLSLQLFRSDLFEGLKAVNTIGIDVGVSAAVTDRLSLALVLDDLLAKYDYDTSGIFGDAGGSTSDRFPTRLRLGAAYELFEKRVRILAEYESRVSRLEFRSRQIEVVGDTPLETFVSRDLDRQTSHLRFGAEYDLADRFVVRGGVDQFAAEGFSESRPSTGFTIVQPVGSLLARFEYAFVLEPFAVGTMHVIAIKVYL